MIEIIKVQADNWHLKNYVLYNVDEKYNYYICIERNYVSNLFIKIDMTMSIYDYVRNGDFINDDNEPKRASP